MVRAIQMGTEEEALTALDKLISMSARNQPAVDVGREVSERLRFEKAAEWFQTEYPDVVGDPQLMQMMLDKDAELVSSGDRREYKDRYADVGNEIRGWVTKLKGGAQAQTPSQPLEQQSPAAGTKEERKASAASKAAPKVANTKAHIKVEGDEAPESHSEVIAAMAKARGGPQWLNT